MLRREDPALLTGEASYTDDLAIPGALHLAVRAQPVRPRPHHVASTRRRPRRCPGVVAVYTGADLPGAVGRARCRARWPVTDDMKNPAHYPLAVDEGLLRRRRRRRRRSPPARQRRSDAVDAIDVDYEPLPAVIDLEDALSDRVVIHDDLGTNKCLHLGAQGRRGRGRRGLRRRRPHGQGALHPAAPHPDGDGAPGRRRRAPARSAATSRSTPPPRSRTSSRS